MQDSSLDRNIVGRSWDTCTWSIIGLFAVFQLMQWPLLPRFVDIYYHLSVARGFAEAGGCVTQAFWEYAPVGRPHLYPPLVHVLMMALFEAGLPALFIGRLVECVTFPLFLAILWVVARNVYSSCYAFFLILISSSVFSFYLSCVILLPFALALVLGLLAFWAFENKRMVAAALILGLSFYAHVLMATISLCALCLYGLLSPGRRVAILCVMLLAVGIAFPFLWYQFEHLDFYRYVQVRENRVLEISLLVYCLAVMGSFVAWRRKGACLYTLCLAVALLPLAFTHPVRWLGGLGMMGVFFLAATALEALHSMWVGTWRKQSRSFVLLMVLIFAMLAPILHIYVKDKSFAVRFLDRTIAHMVLPEALRIHRPKEFTIYFQKPYAEVTKIIQAHTTESDIFWSDYNYGGGVLSLLSGRATSSAMLAEVRPMTAFDPLRAARVLVWFKSAAHDVSTEFEPIVSKYGLEFIAETGLAYVFKNPAAVGQVRVPEPSISSAKLVALMGLVLMVIGLDLKWRIFRTKI